MANKEPSYFKRMDAALGINQGSSGGGSSGGGSGTSSSSSTKKKKKEPAYFAEMDKRLGINQSAPEQPALEDFANANPLSATVQSLTNQRDAIANATPGKNDTLTPYMQRRGLAELDNAIQNQTARERAEALPRNPITGTVLSPIGKPPQSQQIHDLLVDAATKRNNPTPDVTAEEVSPYRKELDDLTAQRDSLDKQMSDVETAIGRVVDPTQRQQLNALLDTLLTQRDDLEARITTAENNIKAEPDQWEIAAAERKEKKSQYDALGSQINEFETALGMAYTPEEQDAIRRQMAPLVEQRENLRQELNIPTTGERIGNILEAAGLGVLAGNVDTQRSLYELGQGQRTRQTEAEIADLERELAKAQQQRAEYVEAYGEDSEYVKSTDEWINRYQSELDAYRKVVSAQEGATGETAAIADHFSEVASAATDKAKTDLNGVETFLVDAGINGVQMLTDAALNLATGTPGSLVPLITRSYGSGTQAARQAGADINQQVLYGAATAAVESFTEKMFDGLAGLYGKGYADDMTELILDKVAKESSPEVRAALSMFLSGAGEATEEMVSGRLEPWLNAIYDNGAKIQETYGSLENYLKSWADTGYSMLVGFAMGWSGSVVAEAQNKTSGTAEAPTETRAESPTETKAETPTETPAPAPAPTVEPTVTDTLVDVLQNSRNAETGQVTRKGIDTILADQALIDLFNENSDAKIDGKNNANNRAAIRDNADAVVAALTGTEVAENAPTAPAEPTVANNAPVENITENSQQSSTEQTEGINTPTEAEAENIAETPQGETAETATAEAPETALATTPTEEIAPPESNPVGEVIDTETAQLPPAMKRSQTESNTLQSVAGVMGGEQDSLYYIPITEKQTLREAASRVRQDIGGEMEQLMAKEQWTAADIDTAMTIYGILQADGVRNHDFSAAQAWSRVIQPRGTATGQALQAFSKWSRTGQAVFSDAVTEISENPNLTEAQKTQILTDLQSFSDRFDTITQIGEDGEINVKDLRQLIQDLNKYRKTGTFNPKTFGKILDQIQDTEWLQEFALRQLMAARSDFSNNPSLAQRLKTWQVNSQLSRLGTFFRNIGGNMTFGIQDTLAQDFFGVAIDSLVSKKTGQREVAMDKGWLSSSARKSARNALLKSILEVSGDVDMTGEATRYGNTSSRTNKMSGNGFERFMSRWEQLLGYSLTSSDRFSRGQIETSVAEGLMRANGGNMTQEQAEAIAKQVADYRLFQNNGTAAQFSRSVHDALNKVGVKGPNGESFGLGDLLNPYPGVPANLGVKALEYSPANIIKGGLELHKILSDYKNGVEVETGRQNQAVMNMARGLSGAPAIALFALLFKKGVFKNADDEDDLDAKAQKTAEGQTGVQINLSAMKRTLQGESSDWKDGDDLMSLGWLEPLNAFLAIGSMVADSAEDESFWSMAKEYPQAYLEGSLQSIIDMPVMSNIKNMMDSYNYSNAEGIGGKIGDMALQGAGDAISGMIPAPVGQFAKATDPMQRSTKGDSDFETVVNGIISNIPGLRETLSPKLDSYGNEREYSGTDTQRWLNTFVLPGAINEYSQNDIQKLTDDLYESTGDAAVFPDRKPPSSLKFGSESVKLSTEQQDAYQKKAGETIQNLVDRTTHTSAWNTLTDGEKVSALDGIYKYGEYIAKKEFAEENGYKMSDSVYSKYEKLDDPAEGIIWNNRWSEATANGEQDYVAMDKVISEMNRMSDDVREMMENKDYVQKLEDASALGIGSRDFFITHDFLSGISKAVKEGTPLDYNAIDKGVQQYAKVVDSEEKADVFSSYFSKGDELAEAAKNGMGSEEWFKYYNKYKEVSDLTTDENGDKISANSKHDAFNNFVDMSDISPEQKEMLKGQFTFFTGYTVDDTTYDKMVRGGADPEAAYRWVQEQGDLVPTGDHKSVTSNQKAFVILNDKSLDPADRIEAILNTDGSVVKPNQGEMARWLNSNFSYSEAKYYWSQLQSKFGWSKKTSYEKALHK